MQLTALPMLEFNYKFALLSAKYEVEKRGWLFFGAKALATFGGALGFFMAISPVVGKKFGMFLG